MYIFCSKLSGESGSADVRRLLDRAFFGLYGVHAPKIAKTEFGKPYFPDAPDIFFSLSHSSSHALCAISTSPVGADIESTGRRVSKRLISRICTESELSEFDFTELWTLKESLIKLKGNILTMPSKSLCFSRTPSGLAAARDFAAYGRSYADIPGCCVSVCSHHMLFPDQIQML